MFTSYGRVCLNSTRLEFAEASSRGFRVRLTFVWCLKPGRSE